MNFSLSDCSNLRNKIFVDLIVYYKKSVRERERKTSRQFQKEKEEKEDQNGHE